MERLQDFGFLGEDDFDAGINDLMGEDSGSDNNDIFPMEFQVDGNSSNNNASSSNGRKRKKCHRHTREQTRELENFFKNCAHPDAKQRQEISTRLGLEHSQVKFWFQNRRTQMKTRVERQENVTLKERYDNLRVENMALRNSMKNLLCRTCGGPAILSQLSLENEQLKIESARLKKELVCVNAIAVKLLGSSVSGLADHVATLDRTSGLDQAIGGNGSNGQTGPMGLNNLENGVPSFPVNGAAMNNQTTKPTGNSSLDQSVGGNGLNGQTGLMGLNNLENGVPGNSHIMTATGNSSLDQSMGVNGYGLTEPMGLNNLGNGVPSNNQIITTTGNPSLNMGGNGLNGLTEHIELNNLENGAPSNNQIMTTTRNSSLDIGSNMFNGLTKPMEITNLGNGVPSTNQTMTTTGNSSLGIGNSSLNMGGNRFNGLTEPMEITNLGNGFPSNNQTMTTTGNSSLGIGNSSLDMGGNRFNGLTEPMEITNLGNGFPSNNQTMTTTGKSSLGIGNSSLDMGGNRFNGLTEYMGLNNLGNGVPSYNQIITKTGNSSLDMGGNRLNGITEPMGLNNLGNKGPRNSYAMNGSTMTSEFDKTVYKQAGIAAMEELFALAQAEKPLWFRNLEGKELMNYEEYSKTFLPFPGVRPTGFAVDATRETSSIYITSEELVDVMMFPKTYKDMFPCMIGKTSTIEVLFTGENGTRDGELQLMSAELVFPSPLLPLRQEKFLRYAKKRPEGIWVVVDVSLDTIRESSYSSSSVKWRRHPSGFFISDVNKGFSQVTWVEHSEYDENYIPQLYKPLLRSGLAFGAQRWLATLKRECESAIVLSSSISRDDSAGPLTKDNKRNVIKLMKRISDNLCSALSGSSASHWQKLQIHGLDAAINIMSRMSFGNPGEPSGLVLSASTSVWLNIPRQKLFNFLRDGKHRGMWDILANGGPMHVISGFSKDRNGNDLISMLCPPAAPQRESNMLILQEAWMDRTGSFIVYAPVDESSMGSILKGADSDYVAVLPSGFSITDAPFKQNAYTLTSQGGENSIKASVLTLGFQILVSSIPTAMLNIESVTTINNLLSSTIQNIRYYVAAN